MVRARNAAIPAARTEAQLVKSTVLVSQSHGFESRSSANVFQALFPQPVHLLVVNIVVVLLCMVSTTCHRIYNRCPTHPQAQTFEV